MGASPTAYCKAAFQDPDEMVTPQVHGIYGPGGAFRKGQETLMLGRPSRMALADQWGEAASQPALAAAAAAAARAAAEDQLVMSKAPSYGNPAPFSPTSSYSIGTLSTPLAQSTPVAQTTLEPPRPGETGVTIERPTEGKAVIGLHVKPEGHDLRITAITEGLLKEWNVANPKQQAQVGSLIKAVNGVREETTLMLEQIRTSRVLILYIVPPAKGQAQQ